jgi:hypothetical protein
MRNAMRIDLVRSSKQLEQWPNIACMRGYRTSGQVQQSIYTNNQQQLSMPMSLPLGERV